jgi:hypothetical protein
MAKLNPSLTTILIASIIALFVLTMAITAYENLMIDNAGTIDSQYEAYYGNLTEEGSEITGLGEDLSDQGNILGDIFSGVTAGINVFVVGLTAIGTFFKMIPILSSVLTIIESGIPGFSGLFGLFTIIAGIYIAMRYIQSARSSQDVP